MSEYRTVATLTAEGTFVVPAPTAMPEGTQAEVTLRIDDASRTPVKTLEEFYRWLESQPARESTWEAEQAMLRQLRDEWD